MAMAQLHANLYFFVQNVHDLVMEDVNCIDLASASAAVPSNSSIGQEEVRIFGCAKEIDGAEKHCQDLGGHLASLRSAQDFASLELAVVRAAAMRSLPCSG